MEVVHVGPTLEAISRTSRTVWIARLEPVSFDWSTRTHRQARTPSSVMGLWRWAIFGLGDELATNVFRGPPRATTELRTRGTALVTGATSGIGEACAHELARCGYDVRVGGRNVTRAEAVARAIRAQGGEARAMRVDLSSVEAARESAAAASGVALLVNNAAVMGVSRAETMTVNLLATCALTAVVAPKRTVFVGSSSHLRAHACADPSLLDDCRKDRDLRAYAQSKLCLMHYAHALEDKGWDVRTCHPGLVWTPMLHRQLGPLAAGLRRFPALRRRLFKDPDEGAATLVAAALDDDEGGTRRYYVHRKLEQPNSRRISPESRSAPALAWTLEMIQPHLP